MISIIEPFLKSLKAAPQRNALWVNHQNYSYAELYQHALPVWAWLKKGEATRCLIFSQRSIVAYVGIVASLLQGMAYVPLNPKMPAARNAMMIDLAATDVMIADAAVAEELEKVLAHYEQPKFRILLLNVDQLPAWTLQFPSCEFELLKDTHAVAELTYQAHENQDACLLFTSGSTGVPKGVMLSHENILSYIREMVVHYHVTENERISQMTELTFDFSVQDMFMAWMVGAAVYAFPENYFIGLPKYLNDNQISFMTTVPSTARLLHQLGKLKPGAFPYLRQNIFGGEPFSDSIAALWQEAAPNASISNVCGPTEATIAYLFYPWDRSHLTAKAPRDCIPLGRPFPHQKICIVDEHLHPVEKGEIGELCLSGTQVIDAYWRNPQLTQSRFVLLPDESGQMCKWYRTGDMVLWSEEDGIVFKGRVDDQIQIRGCRVEKLEIERTLREVSQSETTAIIPWPIAEDGTVLGVIAFVAGSPSSAKAIMQSCRALLPDYMAPKEVHIMENLPLNFNGKIDFLQLKKWREAQN